MAYKPHDEHGLASKMMVVCTIGLLSPELALLAAGLLAIREIGAWLWKK